MRPRTRDAVSAFVVQIGFKTRSTSLVEISSKPICLIGPAYSRRVIFHCATCFGLRHCGDMDSMNWSAASPKLRALAVFFSVSGSRPSGKSLFIRPLQPHGHARGRHHDAPQTQFPPSTGSFVKKHPRARAETSRSNRGCRHRHAVLVSSPFEPVEPTDGWRDFHPFPTAVPNARRGLPRTDANKYSKMWGSAFGV